jgi:hypothetical protein
MGKVNDAFRNSIGGYYARVVPDSCHVGLTRRQSADKIITIYLVRLCRALNTSVN